MLISKKELQAYIENHCRGLQGSQCPNIIKIQEEIKLNIDYSVLTRITETQRLCLCCVLSFRKEGITDVH